MSTPMLIIRHSNERHDLKRSQGAFGFFHANDDVPFINRRIVELVMQK